MDATKVIIDTVDRYRQRRTAPLVLELDLTEGLTQGPPADPLSAILSMRRTSLADVLSGLKRGGKDPRVKALVVKIGGQPLGLAMVQELREAVARFRGVGQARRSRSPRRSARSAAGTVPYYLASAFERVYLQPSGDVGLTGVAMEAAVRPRARWASSGSSTGSPSATSTRPRPTRSPRAYMTEPHRESVGPHRRVGHRAGRGRRRRGPRARPRRRSAS